MGAGAMKRWPKVTSPVVIPSISICTTSEASCGIASVQTMRRNGLTQRSASGFVDAGPQRMDFGHGNERTIAGMISAIASLVSRPGFSITAT